MNTRIDSLVDALGYLMQGLYYAETRLIHDLDSCCSKVTASSLKREIENYISSSNNKVLKVERTLNYLMKEPLARKNDVIDKLLEATRLMLASSDVAHLRDQLAIACIQNINAYKATTYRTAYLFALELELDTVADIIQQILEWETASKKVLAEMANESLNSSQITKK